MYGCCQAHSPEEKAVAIEEAVVRLMGMLTWLRKYKFLPTSQLRNYHPLVRPLPPGLVPRISTVRQSAWRIRSTTSTCLLLTC